MQTFLPYPDFTKSAACLDTKRLGKQRVEAKQIYLAITNPNYGWQNHPAVLMWREKPHGVLIYGVAICREWQHRGYKDTLLDWFCDQWFKCQYRLGDPSDLPGWFGDPSFHLSHQSNLVRKLPSHYRQFFPNVPDDLPYIWPVS